MNLAIDIGNTLAKAAVIDGGQVVDVYKTETLTPAWLDEIFAACPGIDRAILSSVRGGEEALAGWLQGRLKRFIRFDHTTPVPIENGYKTPETLGCDRLAAAVGAAVLFPGEDVLVVDFGTAITLDLLTADGTFCGGNISPGAAARFSALHDYTKKLPLRALADTVETLGKTTHQAIESGVVNGIVYEIEGTADRLYGKHPSLRILFTGGDAKFFEKRVKFPIFATQDLVLTGLNKILEYNVE